MEGLCPVKRVPRLGRGMGSPAFWVVLAVAFHGCDATPARTGEATFRCIDNSWFEVRRVDRGEIIVVQPDRIQIRIREASADKGGWRYEGGGYSLSGKDREAIWIRENGVPIRCIADRNILPQE